MRCLMKTELNSHTNSRREDKHATRWPRQTMGPMGATGRQETSGRHRRGELADTAANAADATTTITITVAAAAAAANTAARV